MSRSNQPARGYEDDTHHVVYPTIAKYDTITPEQWAQQLLNCAMHLSSTELNTHPLAGTNGHPKKMLFTAIRFLKHHFTTTSVTTYDPRAGIAEANSLVKLEENPDPMEDARPEADIDDAARADAIPAGIAPSTPAAAIAELKASLGV